MPQVAGAGPAMTAAPESRRAASKRTWTWFRVADGCDSSAACRAALLVSLPGHKSRTPWNDSKDASQVIPQVTSVGGRVGVHDTTSSRMRGAHRTNEASKATQRRSSRLGSCASAGFRSLRRHSLQTAAAAPSSEPPCRVSCRSAALAAPLYTAWEAASPVQQPSHSLRAGWH